MQAMTKIFPVFFAFICFGLNAGATLYFVVSNAWRIGQQHLVIGKLYDQGIAAGQIKPKEDTKPSEPTGDAATGNAAKGTARRSRPATGRARRARHPGSPAARDRTAKRPTVTARARA